MCTSNAPSYFSTALNLNRIETAIIILWHAPYWVYSSLGTVHDELVHSSLALFHCMRACVCLFLCPISLSNCEYITWNVYMRFHVSPRYSNEAPIYHSGKASIYSFSSCTMLNFSLFLLILNGKYKERSKEERWYFFRSIFFFAINFLSILAKHFNVANKCS